MYQVRKGTIALALVSLIFMMSASASIIGDLKTGSGGTVTVSLSSIIFNPDPSADPRGPLFNGQVSNGTDLTFAGCPSGVLGTPGCLDVTPFSPSEAVEIANAVPITFSGGLGPNNPFIQFAGNGITHATLLYTVTQLGPASSNTNCAGLGVGDSCSVFAGSPILLTFTGVGTTVSLAVRGIATDGAGESNWMGVFQVPIAMMTPQDIKMFYCPTGTCTEADFASGKSLTSSQAGDFMASAVPEPGTVSMALIGLGLSALAFRKRKTSSK